MNIFGIGPSELILIMIVLLVVVGPERLPGLARQGGQLLVRVRNWVQHSPDAAMIMRARQEIEQELSSLRSSLLEVQNARDEVIEMAKQVNQSVTEDVFDAVKQATQAMQGENIKLVEQSASAAVEAANTATHAAEVATAAADSATNGAASADASVAADGLANPSALGSAPSAEAASDVTAPTIARSRTRGASVQSAVVEAPPATHNGHAAAAPSDVQLLSEQVQMLIRDMQALQQTLHDRGALGDANATPSTPSDDEHLAMMLANPEERS